MNDDQTIGGRLKIVRGGKTQKEFALELDISAPSLQKYELDESVPGGLALAKLAEKGINVNWILTGKGSMHILLPDDRLLQELAFKVFVATRGKDDVSEVKRAKLLTRAYRIAMDDGLKAAEEYVDKMVDVLEYYS
ncbi:MAG: helix-turn-helix transcriptional regulator [Desulfuromonadaceae bacterium]|nr:helix-turn-helix transcriptional regulator [Desulfuromonadaceae bacterium]MDD2856435.1 helix-turn-helix transcriptional regulator [Desulfuromonadaceae bacterium]